MTFDQIVAHYGSVTAVHKALNISRQAVYYWKKKGNVPLTSQFMLERLTNGALTVTMPERPAPAVEG